MVFNSLQFLIYFPIVVTLYFIFPFKYRWMWLLVSSYYFYMSWNPQYALLMLISTMITYLSGLLIERAKDIPEETKRVKRKKTWVALSFISNLAILFFFKYFNFFNESIAYLLNQFGLVWSVPNFNVLLPVGISFYTFQALSYTMDVYRGDIRAERHFGRYALFVSFFPQLVAGPIERSKHLLPQFKARHKFDYDRIKDGLLFMLWGFFKKVVIADRLALLVNTVYDHPTAYGSLEIIIATLFFAFQIYCDFSSYSDIAIGSAQVMGYDLMDNFNQPYFSKSIREFWRRWHISLGLWFRDYLYIPLGGGRVEKWKKYRNIIIVFLVSGLWHGASWNFVIWGFLHGLYQVVGMELKPLRDRFVKILKIDRSSWHHRLYKMVVTFILVCFSWIFFRANRFTDAIYMVKSVFQWRTSKISLLEGGLYGLGLDRKEFLMALWSLVVLLFVDFMQQKKNLLDSIRRRPILFRWAFYLTLIFIILIFGAYGDYDETQFIYFQF